MTTSTILNLVTVFLAGLLSGMEFAVHYGVRGPAETLDDRAQLQLRQALARRLRVLVPAFFLPTTVGAIVITALDWTIPSWTAPGWWLRVAGLLALLIWILIRVIGTVPINSATLSWSLDAPPKNWKALVTRAERFHIVGVWAVVVTFACFLTAMALQLAAQ
jgi:hypothetical protein